MYTTATKTWVHSILIDGTVLGLLIASFFFGIPYTEKIAVFFLWWAYGLSIFFNVTLLFVHSSINNSLKKFQRELTRREAQRLSIGDLRVKIAEAEEAAENVWPATLVKKLSVSTAYFVYRVATDLSVAILLLVSGHEVLASFQIISLLLSTALIREAWKKTKESGDVKTDEELQQDFAKFRSEIK